MSRQAVSLHVKILLECGVIEINQKGRERYCSLIPNQLAEVSDWLEPFRTLWEGRLDNLDSVLKNLKKQ
jgi:DNA-binding transcriptional ArsR family regulator